MTRELHNQLVIMCALAQMLTDKPSKAGRALAHSRLLEAIERTRVDRFETPGGVITAEDRRTNAEWQADALKAGR